MARIAQRPLGAVFAAARARAAAQTAPQSAAPAATATPTAKVKHDLAFSGSRRRAYTRK